MEVNHVLVVEDDKEILDGIGIYLASQGYQVWKAQNGEEGLKVLENTVIHLAIVDIMMPVMSGVEMIQKLRENYEFPVIVLSAKSEEMDKITGLSIGADDYVTKPFAPMELLARVNSHLRRYQKYLQLKEGMNQQNSTKRYIVGGLEIDEETKEVFVDDKLVKLTPLEYKILLLLMKYPGKVFSAEEIYQSVWKEKPITTDTIMVHIRRIREKIEIDVKNPRYLKVVWGIGYKIEKQ